MKVNELKELTIQDIEKMSKKELLEVTKTAQKIARKRFERLEQYKSETGIQPIATTKFDGEEFTRDISSANIRKLRKELKKSVAFIKHKATTLTGAKKARAKIERELGLTDLRLSPEERTKQEENVFGAYKRFIELNRSLKLKYGSDVILRNALKIARESPDHISTEEKIIEGLEEGYATLKYGSKLKGIGRFTK